MKEKYYYIELTNCFQSSSILIWDVVDPPCDTVQNSFPCRLKSRSLGLNQWIAQGIVWCLSIECVHTEVIAIQIVKFILAWSALYSYILVSMLHFGNSWCENWFIMWGQLLLEMLQTVCYYGRKLFFVSNVLVRFFTKLAIYNSVA